MPPSSSPSRRLLLLGCLLIGALALLPAGCGAGGAATGADTVSTQTKAAAKPKAPTTTGGCPSQVDAFVKSLGTLRRQLATGLSYEQYAAKVKSLQGSYDKLPVDRLTLKCVTTTGTPAEAALNKYIDATNAWGDCLADASCSTATIEPVLQRKWRVASGFLAEAQ
jgi:hypothetical protein